MIRMAKIDIHSDEWQVIQKFIDVNRKDAIKSLIDDDQSEKQRGILSLLERLETLPEQKALTTQPETNNLYNF